MSPILVMLTSCTDSDFEHSNFSLKENEFDGIDPNSNNLDYCVQRMKKVVQNIFQNNAPFAYELFLTPLWDMLYDSTNF